LLRFDEGRAEVAGYDVRRDPAQVRFRIGLTGQNPAVDEILTGRQNLVMFGKLNHLDARTARRRGRAVGAVRAHRGGRQAGQELLGVE
jgi:ABC-2 type transport system ATP-binding protein